MHCGGRRSGLLTALLVGSQLARDRSDSEPHPASQAASQADPVQCPTCGWRIDKDYAWCPQCGARLQPFQCEYCRSMVPAEAENCTHCGAPVN
jgi:predicted RNA-binding Zn-ribbon protein involved in translation (DUF1610 family)